MSEGTTFTLTFGVDETQLEYMSANDIAAKEGGKKGQFQELELLENLLARDIDGIVIDGGANIGNHTVFFLKHFPTIAAVMSVEPQPAIFEVLMRNVERNVDLTQVHWCPINVALAQEGKKTCHLSAMPYGNAGRTRVVRGGGMFNRDKVLEVPCRTIDELWSQALHERVGLLKLDIEDSECQAIEGAMRMLADCRPIIVAEHHNGDLFDRFESLVRPFGYKVSDKRFEPRGETRIWEPS